MLLAEPMYLAGYIERIGTGTGDIVRWCKEAKLLHEPEFVQDEFFKVIIWREKRATGQAIDNTLKTIYKMVSLMDGAVTREEIQTALGLKGRDNFTKNYLNPALENGYIEMIYPDVPRHPDQAYRLTSKGEDLKKQFHR